MAFLGPILCRGLLASFDIPHLFVCLGTCSGTGWKRWVHWTENFRLLWRMHWAVLVMWSHALKFVACCTSQRNLCCTSGSRCNPESLSQPRLDSLHRLWALMFLLSGRKITLDSYRDLQRGHLLLRFPCPSYWKPCCLWSSQQWCLGSRPALNVLQCQARKGVTQLHSAHGMSVWGGLHY